MSLERLQTMFACEPLLIDPVRVASIRARIMQPQAGAWDEIGKDLEARAKRPEIRVENGVAVVPVCGCLIEGADALDRLYGFVDLGDVRRMVGEASAREDVRGILLHLDTPGGGVTGTEETAEVIANAARSKPVLAWTNTLAASGGMWLASASSAIYATKSATLGSIGVYMAFMDLSEMAKAMGVKVDVIRSSDTPYKGAGVPGTSLSDLQREQFQSQVDFIFSGFKAQINRTRKRASDETMRGQTFTGSQAVQNGLADSIADYATAIKAVRNLSDLRGMGK